MSRIVISTAGGIANTALVAEVRGITREPVARVAAALRDGAPLFDDDLFARAREEQFGRVRLLLHALRAAGVEPVVSEDGHPISAEILLNIMRSSDEDTARFEEMDGLGHTP